MNFAKFSKKSHLQNICRRLLSLDEVEYLMKGFNDDWWQSTLIKHAIYSLDINFRPRQHTLILPFNFRRSHPEVSFRIPRSSHPGLFLRPCSHYTVQLFVASRIVYRIELLLTLETNIWAHFLYRIAAETLRSSKWYITKRYLQRSDFLYNFSNVNTISY